MVDSSPHPPDPHPQIFEIHKKIIAKSYCAPYNNYDSYVQRIYRGEFDKISLIKITCLQNGVDVNKLIVPLKNVKIFEIRADLIYLDSLFSDSFTAFEIEKFNFLKKEDYETKAL